MRSSRWSLFLLSVLAAAHVETAHAQTDVTAYGAACNGSTTDTTAIQSAINSIPSNGGLLLFPPGAACKTGNLQISNKSNLIIDCRGARITWTGTGGYIGFEQIGTNQNITVQNCRFIGDGVAANGHAGLWNSSGQTLTDIKFINNECYNVVVCVSVAADSSGTVTGVLIQGNYLENIVGTGTGQGYGIHLSSVQSTPVNGRVVQNTIVNSYRHAIYIAMGNGFVVSGNSIRNHRSVVADGSQRAALTVARSQHVEVMGNTFYNCSDGTIEVVSAAGFTTRHVAIFGNTIREPADTFPALVVGSLAPSTDGTPNDVIVSSNTFYQDGARLPFVRLYHGKHVRIADNLFEHTNNSGAGYAITLEGQQESAGTSNYSDDIQIERNLFSGNNASGTLTAIRVEPAFATSGARVDFRGNLAYPRIDYTFSTPTAITNTNVGMFDQTFDGFAFGSNIVFRALRLHATATIDIGAVPAGGTLSTATTVVPGVPPTAAVTVSPPTSLSSSLVVAAGPHATNGSIVVRAANVSGAVVDPPSLVYNVLAESH